MKNHQPAWLNEAVFYNIYPQSFCDSNADGIGDLQGIIQKMPYIREMGFTAIWLNPIFDSPFQDAGYDIRDFYRVAPRYGTNEDFAALCRCAHSCGIHVCMDLVAGHTSIECEWFRQSCRAEKNEYSNRYIWTDDWGKSPDGGFINGYAARNGNYMKNFFYSQPALNYGYGQIDDPAWQLSPDHPDCRANKQELIHIMEFWLGLGCDGFRVDMAASVIKNDYPDGRCTCAFWQEIRGIFDEKYPECVLISEWSNPALSLKAGFHIDFLIHFNFAAYTLLLRAEKGRNVNETYLGHSYFTPDGQGDFSQFLKDYEPQYRATRELGFISLPTGNHDIPRVAYRRTEPELKTVMAFLLTMPGVPFVYYGDEIGMRYLPGLPSKEGGYNRTGARTPMQWDGNVNAGFSCAGPGSLYLPLDPDPARPTVAAQWAQPDSLLETVRRLIALRKNHPALQAAGEFRVLPTTTRGYPLVYLRKAEGEQILVAINPLAQSDKFACALPKRPLLVAEGVCEEAQNVVLPPFGFGIWQVTGETEVAREN